MGRPRSSNPLNLPPRVYGKHGAFYYFHRSGTWERLGTDVEEAKRRAAEIANNLSDGFGLVPYWLDEFLAHCRQRVKAGDLSPRTCEDYEGAADKLRIWFKDFHPSGVEPSHVGTYLDTGLSMGRAVRANRERACLSAMFTWLIRKGYGGIRVNPCIGVRRNRETKRERYVESDEMSQTLAKAPVQVWGVAHLVYRTLQRPEDVITWTSRNLTEREDAAGRKTRILRTKQSKTGASVDIEITPEIDAIIDRLRAESMPRPSSGRRVISGMTLIHRRDGKPYTYDGLCSMLKRAQDLVRDLHAIKGGKLAEMPSWGFYDMKGKGATDMWLNGIRLELIQVLCGHDSVKTTERYVKSRWRGIVIPNQTPITG